MGQPHSTHVALTPLCEQREKPTFAFSPPLGFSDTARVVSVSRVLEIQAQTLGPSIFLWKSSCIRCSLLLPHLGIKGAWKRQSRAEGIGAGGSVECSGRVPSPTPYMVPRK